MKARVRRIIRTTGDEEIVAPFLLWLDVVARLSDFDGMNTASHLLITSLAHVFLTASIGF